MSVYHRYFQIKDTATLAAIAKALSDRAAYRAGLLAIKAEIGASSLHFYSRSGTFAGFGFDKAPDPAVFKKVDSGVFFPKKSAKAGKDLAVRVSAFKAPTPINDVLKIAGLSPDFCLSGEGTRAGFVMHSASICGSDKAGWFAVVPWKDEDPAVLEEYKADKAAGTRGSSELDHLLWTPPAEWVAVKEWEMKKALDEQTKSEAA